MLNYDNTVMVGYIVYRAGILAYNGAEVLKLTDKIWAVPISVLLS